MVAAVYLMAVQGTSVNGTRLYLFRFGLSKTLHILPKIYFCDYIL